MREVYRVVAVEDSDREFALLRRGLESYERDRGLPVALSRFTRAEDFLAAYRGDCDLVFLDIRLPGMNGMSGAEQLRRVDASVALVFITNLAQYAVNGYAVDALDYIVKPLSPKKLYYVMDKALRRAGSGPEGKRVTFRGVSSLSSVPASAIAFVEVSGHRVTAHLADGGEIAATDTLSGLYDELKDWGFERCNSCYLVNLRYVEALKGDAVLMATGQALPVSRRRKRAFAQRLMDYLTHT